MLIIPPIKNTVIIFHYKKNMDNFLKGRTNGCNPIHLTQRNRSQMANKHNVRLLTGSHWVQESHDCNEKLRVCNFPFVLIASSIRSCFILTACFLSPQ